MKIGILSAELDKESIEENEILTEEIMAAGHEAVIISYGDGHSFVDLNERQLYVVKDGVAEPFENPDVVIPRINESDKESIFFGVLTLQALIDQGVPSVLKPEAIELVKNKAKTLYLLEKRGIQTPHTIVPTSIKVARSGDFLSIIEPDPQSEVVIKSTHGTTGEGTKIQSDRKSAKGVLDDNRDPTLLQKFIRTPGYEEGRYSDVRVIVVGGIAVESFKREATEDYRANIYREGELIEQEATDEEKELAIRAADILDLEIAGVDIFESPDGLLVNELNASVGFATGKARQHRIARYLFDYAIQKTT